MMYENVGKFVELVIYVWDRLMVNFIEGLGVRVFVGNYMEFLGEGEIFERNFIENGEMSWL